MLTSYTQQAIDDFAFNSKKYRHLLLSPQDWDAIEALNSVLQVRVPWPDSPCSTTDLESDLYEGHRNHVSRKISDALLAVANVRAHA